MRRLALHLALVSALATGCDVRTTGRPLSDESVTQQPSVKPADGPPKAPVARRTLPTLPRVAEERPVAARPSPGPEKPPVRVPPLTPAPEAPEGQSDFETPITPPRAVGGTAQEPPKQEPPAQEPPRQEPPAQEAPAADRAAESTADRVPERLIEESDIYKLVGTTLYVLNRYRGLQVIDLTDLDRPRMIGRAPIFGYPREMYFRGNNVYVIVSDYYTFWRDTESQLAPNAFYGSQVRIIDVTDPGSPSVRGGINLSGEAIDSRIVGDVMYVAVSRVPWYRRYDSTDTEDKTQVLSISIADPANVHLVDVQDFPRNGWEHHLYVTPRTIYLASSGNAAGTWDVYETRIRYVDIGDPGGAIRIRGEAVASGRVQDRWSMDEHEGVLRVASGQFWGNGDVYLTTFSVAEPDAIKQLGTFTLHVDERLTSARFDGPNAYLVSYRNIDPLFHVDVSDPAAPRLVGELEMTGWLDFMVPMGDRIVALGHEDVVDPQGFRSISLAVSLVGVSKTEPPVLLSRATVGEGWGFVPGTRDDFAKVFKVLPEQGLVLFPFQSWSRTDWRMLVGVQLLDLSRDAVQRRGLIENAGWVERGIPHGPETVLTLSSEIFQVMDIRDRDRPRLRGRLELARNVTEFAPLSSAHAVQLSGYWNLGDTKLTVTPLLDPDTPSPTAELHVPAPYGRMFTNGAMAYVVSRDEVVGSDGQVTGYVTKVEVYDLSDPAAPRARGAVRLPEEVGIGYRSWYWGSGDEAVQVQGSTLAFHRFKSTYWYARPEVACFECTPQPVPPAHTIYLVDLRDADQPVLASTVRLEDASWAWGLKASGSHLYLSYYHVVEHDERSYQRYYLQRVDVSDPAAPVVLPAVNIPGMYVGSSDDGRYVYTLETVWDFATSTQHTYFYALALLGDTAYLRGKVELKGYVNNILVKEGAAFATTQWWEQTMTRVTDTVMPYYYGTNHVALVTIDLADARFVRIAGQVEIPYDYAYLQKVEGERAFIGSGAGIFTYLVRDITQPAFEEFFRTQGWSQEIVVRGDVAFVASGYYGVQVLRLGTQ